MANCQNLVDAVNAVANKLNEAVVKLDTISESLLESNVNTENIQKHLGARLIHRDMWKEIAQRLLDTSKYSGEINAERLGQQLQYELGYDVPPASNAIAPQDLDLSKDIDTPGVV